MKAWIGIGIFVGVLIVAFALFAIHISKSPAPPVAPAATTAAITNVRVSDAYKSGVHTIHGKATVPTACTTLVASSTIITEGLASTSPIIRIDLSAPIDTGMCLELPTDASFSFTPHAPSGASIEVFANGELATTTPL